MAFTTKEIRDNYLTEIRKYCPKYRRGRTYVDTVLKQGNLSAEMIAHLEQKGTNKKD